MRRLVLVSLLWLPALGCGGSSSETPPPLEPDPTSAAYTGPRMPNAADAKAPPAAASPEEDDSPARPRRAATATWGSGRSAAPSPSVAPSMTSPTALPSTPGAAKLGAEPSNY